MHQKITANDTINELIKPNTILLIENRLTK
jgi:hypothetical protein